MAPSSRSIPISTRPPPPLGVVLPSRDPLARVLDLGGKATAGIVAGIAFALLVHGTAGARAALINIDLIHWADGVRRSVHERLWSQYDVDMFKAPEEKLAPPPEPAPEADPEPVKAKAPPPEKAKDEPPPEPPAPAAAQAGQILTAPDEIADFTDPGFIQGTGPNFAGGVTHAQGTATTAVRNLNARPDGTTGGTGTAPAPPPPPTPDRSRAAGLRGSSDWKCPPSEADAEQIDDAYVTVQVSVGADGRAIQVQVMSDPGHGFGREARLCAMRETYTTAANRDGNPIPGQTKPFRIHFER
jgi:protein TonB